MVRRHKYAVGDLFRYNRRVLQVVKLLDPVDDLGLECYCVDIIARDNYCFVREDNIIPVRRTPRIALACWLIEIANWLIKGDEK